MKVVIAGAGNIGRYLSVDLHERGHDVTLIDQSDAALAMVPSRDLRMLRGDACSPATLEVAGTPDADVVVAATGDDEDNLVISLLSKQEFAVPRVLARVNHPVNEWLFDDSWGVDLAVSPPHLLAALVEEEVSTGDFVSLFKLQRGRVQLLEIRLDERSPAIEKRVDDLNLPANVALLALVREGNVVTCRATTPLVVGDEILALVADGQTDELRRQLIGDR